MTGITPAKILKEATNFGTSAGKKIGALLEDAATKLGMEETPTPSLLPDIQPNTAISESFKPFSDSTAKAMQSYEAKKAFYYAHNLLDAWVSTNSKTLIDSLSTFNLDEFSKAISSNPNHSNDAKYIAALRVLLREHVIKNGTCGDAFFKNAFLFNHKFPEDLCAHVTEVNLCEYERNQIKQYYDAVHTCIMQMSPHGISTSASAPANIIPVAPTSTAEPSPTPAVSTPIKDNASIIHVNAEVSGNGAGALDDVDA